MYILKQKNIISQRANEKAERAFQNLKLRGANSPTLCISQVVKVESWNCQLKKIDENFWRVNAVENYRLAKFRRI